MPQTPTSTYDYVLSKLLLYIMDVHLLGMTGSNLRISVNVDRHLSGV